MSAAATRERLEVRIEREREALAHALADVGEQARASLDLRRRVCARPTAWLAGAWIVGLWLGARR